MKLTFKWYEPLLFVEKLSEQIGVISQRNYLEEVITLPPAYGEGTISGFQFRSGISLLVFDLILEKKWQLNFINEMIPPLQFNYVVDGAVYHRVDEFNVLERIDSMHNSIIGTTKGGQQTLIFPAKAHFLLAILQVDKNAYFGEMSNYSEACPQKIKDIFYDTYGANFYFDIKRFSIQTARCIKKVSTIPNQGVTKNILVESIVLEILGRQIKDIQKSLLPEKKQVRISEEDIHKLSLAKNIIEEHYKTPPTIVELAKKVGINQQKLKVGFKEVYETTINKYATNIRLDKAADLIAQGFNVKEAMYGVGYASFSFFAKKFKDRFGLLPKDYRKNIYNQIKTG